MGGGSDCALEDELICHLFLGSYKIHEFFQGAHFRNTLYESLTPLDKHSSHG
jgi:hypothetical protein